MMRVGIEKYRQGGARKGRIQQDFRQIVDEEDLRVLPVLYWVSAAFLGVYALFMTAYFAFIGTVFVAIPFEEDGPPRAFGWAFLGVAAIALLIAATVVTLKALTGFWLRKRRHRVATMVIAALTCLEIPYGTMTGVFTFVVLARPSVRALYEGAEQASAPPLPEFPPPAGQSEAPAEPSVPAE